ncbi:hypothetical protein BDY19DRAFT_997463 [Irpex rosettiformis]|uniref:Uncharacterized protein n=1 Tax=Irpex rosettiformis TaxID=378272 RepID=A0ACB8TRU2_9APHY|nr:hypothetical protein BDY19DRAFT_997463 [Irpex rosettiformis]
MGLLAILSVLHLASILQRRQAEGDPEKGEVREENGEGRGRQGDQEGHNPENEADGDEDLTEDPLSGPHRLHRIDSATGDTFFSTSVDDKGLHEFIEKNQPWYQRVRYYIFPKEESEESLEKFAPNYRWTPIISGVIIPFSILLEIPGLTEHWYIRTEGNSIVEVKPNPAILDVALAISMAFALAANICLILRFLERRVKAMTLLTILFLTIHDIINIVVVTIFGVQHRFNDGFTYGQSFWLTVCSTSVSSITNITLIVDYIRTPQFSRSGSGLTRKQRALVIIVIVLLLYIAFGALVNSFLLDLDFVNGLYFTVVTIETIGFGDIHPDNTSSRVFTCCYLPFGIINIGVAVAMTRETVLEGLELGYRKRVRVLRKRRIEAKRFRRWEVRWRRAVEWRLREAGKPIWVPDERYSQEKVRFVGLRDEVVGNGEAHWLRKWIDSIHLKRVGGDRRPLHLRRHPSGKHLNINALSTQQLEAAALEAGVPLEMFLDVPHMFPPEHHKEDHSRAGLHRDKSVYLKWFRHRSSSTSDWPSSPQTPTHAQVGRIAAMLTKFAFAVTGAHVHMNGRVPETHGYSEREAHQAAAVPQQIIVRPEEQDSKTSGGQVDGSAGSGAGVTDGIVTEGRPYPKLPEPVAGYSRKEAFGFVHDKDLSDDAKWEERRAHISKLIFAWSIFFFFWFVGAAIFHVTEGWSYGNALYFCFCAFTTTGYGDFAPTSPVGRSVFVVWALMGVATMTILIAVIEEAGSSKYKRALHSKAFDIAVKKFRQQENRKTEAIAARSHIELPRTPDDVSLEQATREASITAQRELEQLPHQILRRGRIFHSHMQYLTNNNSVDTSWGDTKSPEETAGTGGAAERDRMTGTMTEKNGGSMSRTPAELRSLLDEISNLEEIGERAKKDIMEDDDTRNTLLMLSIETNLRRLINAAQRSLGALAERDSLLALQRQREDQGRASSSKAPTTSADSDTIRI